MPTSVLIIDDEPRISVALMIRLQAYGYEVFHAINGLAGVEAAALHQPDAIILDIRMPDIDGFETCQRIRRLPQLSEVPVIFLSANVQDEAKIRAEEVGGSDFLSKPYEASDVIQALNAHLGLDKVPNQGAVQDEAGKKPVVMLVDNDESLVAALQLRFEHAGYQCITAGTGAQGVAMATKHGPDFIVTDLLMPGGDGIALIESLRRSSSVPIAVLTGYEKEQQGALAAMDGVWVFEKPCDFSELRDLVAREVKASSELPDMSGTNSHTRSA